MKILFNTKSPNKPASEFYISGLKRLKCVNFFDTENYRNYDSVLFMGYSEDLEEISKAKQDNPDILVGIIDPKSKESVIPNLNQIDFFIVDSIEMSDFWQDFGRPIFTYYEYPSFDSKIKNHSDKDEFIIGYHGNKVHLTSFFPNITRALETLGKKYSITLKAIYNISELGKWNIGRPKNIQIEDIQWNSEIYENELALADIGIIPSLIPLRENSKKNTVLDKFFLANDDDYLFRFKMLSNPGRLIVFSKLGIPVVAEMSPSHLEFIRNDSNGYIAYSTGAWINAIEKLISSSDLRNRISTEMFQTYLTKFDYDVQNEKLYVFLEELVSGKLNNLKFNSNQQIKTSYLDKLKFRNASMIDLYQKVFRKINRIFNEKN